MFSKRPVSIQCNNVVSYLTLLNSFVSGCEGKNREKNEELLFLGLNSAAHLEND